jgi:hypothetical protein
VKKTIGLQILTALFISVLCASVQVGYSQKTTQVGESIKAEKSLLERYIQISSLPQGAKGGAFREIPTAGQAAIFRFHIALQLMKNADFTYEQRGLLFDSISEITPDFYGDTNDTRKLSQQKILLLGQKAQSLFSKRQVFEIMGNLGGSKVDAVMIQKYEDLTPLNDLQRKAVFRKVSAQEKRDLWRIHIAFFMAMHSDLTVSQRNFISDTLDFMTLEVFELGPKDPQWEAKVGQPIESLTGKVLKAFSKEEAANLVARLGQPQTPGQATPEGGPAPLLADCGCHRGNGDQCWDGVCSGNACNQSSAGCGFLWGQPCNGTACYNP